jgi:hypothetical protein
LGPRGSDGRGGGATNDGPPPPSRSLGSRRTDSDVPTSFASPFSSSLWLAKLAALFLDVSFVFDGVTSSYSELETKVLSGSPPDVDDTVENA